jgi:phytanoyl-CoA dioxygenase PhyH
VPIGRTRLAGSCLGERRKISARLHLEIGDDDPQHSARSEHTPALAQQPLGLGAVEVLEEVRVVDDVEAPAWIRDPVAEIGEADGDSAVIGVRAVGVEAAEEPSDERRAVAHGMRPELDVRPLRVRLIPAGEVEQLRCVRNHVRTVATFRRSRLRRRMGIGRLVHEQLARRAPRLDRLAVRTRWRANNRARGFRPGRLDGAAGSLLDGLKRDGIALGRFEDVFGSEELYEAAAADAHRRAEGARAEHARGTERKPYLVKLHQDPFDVDDPYARIALDPSVLAVANGYMRMRSYILALDLWLTIPLPGSATETQLWHRDNDDYMTPKLFVYFTDVTEADGPFCYAPRTHPRGDRRHEAEIDTPDGRTSDESLAAVVPEDEWIVCTGSAGTVILADTCGYHKQLKPTGGERVLMLTEYTSGTPFYERPFEITCEKPDALTRDQRFALERNP